MPLSIGTLLGSYELVAQIGAGGMGEVYEARDTKLGRNVAIKVLPAAFANDPERLARFQREAKMLAALNHPSIATIYGLEHSNSTHFLIMELVSGDTLAERIKREGAMPVEEALKIAVQIAEALEAAHERGIIHRDLKPANVKVTPEGRVKVLDFGLAKAFAGDGSLDLSNAPTLTAMGTEEGKILGTAAYMSPEQARGKPVDKKTDIWAFGCVLYELLTGKRAFRGETTQDTIAAILEREPNWQALPPRTPAQIRNLLRRCLQKDVNKRGRDAGDLRIEIEETFAAPSGVELAAAAQPKRDWRRVAVLGLAGLALLAVGVVAAWSLKTSPPQPITRTVINLSAGQQLAGLNSPAVALSPDATHLAYVARQGGTQQIYLRALDSLEARPIPGTEGGLSPFFSPDSQWLGFFAAGKLMKVPVSGGATVALADGGNLFGASWGTQGMIAFAPRGVLQEVSDTGGASQPLTRLEKGEDLHVWPEFLPDGKAVLFAAGNGGVRFANAKIVVQMLGTGERRSLIQGGAVPHYARSGYLVYAQAGNLVAAPFDPRRLVVTGTGVPVVEGVPQSYGFASQYSVSATGTLVYIPEGGQHSNESKLVWVSRSGSEQPLAAPAHSYLTPTLSPDGRRVAVVIQGQVWLYDLLRGPLTRLTFEGSLNQSPVWTPDGKRIAFSSNKEGPLSIYWELADGSGGLVERLTPGETGRGPRSFSPDGQLLAFTETNTTTGLDIWVLRMGDRKAQPFLRTRFQEWGPQFSADGRWLAYVSDESDRDEVYVQPYPGPGGKWQISTEGGTEPVWNPNGRELFYRSGDKMMAVEITTQPGFTVGKPRILFEGRYELAPVAAANYAVSPDGQRFLMIKPPEQSSSSFTQIVVVQNWFEELKRRVPAGK